MFSLARNDVRSLLRITRFSHLLFDRSKLVRAEISPGSDSTIVGLLADAKNCLFRRSYLFIKYFLSKHLFSLK